MLELTDDRIKAMIHYCLKPHVTFRSVVKATRTDTFVQVRLDGIAGKGLKSCKIQVDNMDGIVYFGYDSMTIPFTEISLREAVAKARVDGVI